NGRARALAARTDLPADIRRSAEILARESDRITHIVEQLLTFSRRSVPSMADIDMAGPVRDIIELFGPEARRHEVRLEFVPLESPPTATATVAQAQRVALTCRATPVRPTPRGGKARVPLAPSSIPLPDGSVRGSVALVVEDPGEGTPDKVLPYIFEP